MGLSAMFYVVIFKSKVVFCLGKSIPGLRIFISKRSVAAKLSSSKIILSIEKLMNYLT